MTAIIVSSETLRELKAALHGSLPDLRSSHLSECIAVSLGFSSNAALRASFSDNPSILHFCADAFRSRVLQLSGTSLPFAKERLDSIVLNCGPGVAVKTAPMSYQRRPQSKRRQAWKICMVAALNHMVEKRVISVVAGDDRWSSSEARRGVTSHFFISQMPAICHVSDAGFDELSMKVVLWPVAQVGGKVRASVLSRDVAFSLGEVWAGGWLERRDGAWLQHSNDLLFHCRKKRLAELLDLPELRPLGYSDCGPFRF